MVPRADGVAVTPLSTRRCPVAHQALEDSEMEQDFTTPGIIGNLECPFSKLAQPNGLPDTPNSQADPIATEFHDIHTPTIAQPRAKCPIRFLDQHSPEEVAQYFENHKHEIPRSHEICVKRYQQNEASIKQLDAKYGNLVSMIQGLGKKHVEYLPNKEKAINGTTSSSSNSVVEKWAEDVNSTEQPVSIAAQAPEAPEAPDDEALRKSHFDRPLREIRVGESPSRPWGISVPPDQQVAASAEQSEVGSDHTQSQSPPSPPSPSGIRQAEGANEKAKATARVEASTKATARNKARQMTETLGPAIVFNGPVFFGYSADDAAKFLRNLKFGEEPV